MFEVEAGWLEKVLSRLSTECLSPCIDLGSSDFVYRTEFQPWIDERVFKPLALRGVAIHHCDLKNAPGVDVVADLMNDEGRTRIMRIAPNSVLCCNILEHVAEPAAFASRLASLLGPGGYLVLNVPHRYPYHEDPIDNGFRPEIQEVAALFPDFSVVEAAVLEAGSYREEVARQPLRILTRHFARLLLPFLGLQKWKRSVARLSYLFRSYEVTCLLLVKGDLVSEVRFAED